MSPQSPIPMTVGFPILVRVQDLAVCPDLLPQLCLSPANEIGAELNSWQASL